MPHCIIEYSQKLDESELINSVYKGALKSELFEDEDIKTRTIAFDNYQSGPNKQKFVHVTIKLLTGRSIEQRSMLSNLVLSELKRLDYVATSLTVEIIEIERESYAKVVL